MKKNYYLFFVGLLFICGLFFYQQTASHSTETTAAQLEVTGAVTDSTAAEDCLALLQQNLQAANQKDVEGYTATLVSSARESTAKEMRAFFAEYDLSHTLLSFEVVKQDADSMLVAAQQKTMNHGKNDYRDHITQAHHTFVRENGQWKIKETVMTNTEFID
jgi:hypothetical protein